MTHHILNLFLTLLISITFFNINAQSSKEAYGITLNHSIEVDGDISEWMEYSEFKVTEFERNFPDNDSLAQFQTEVWVGVTDENLYVAARMARNPNSRYSISSLQRDFNILENDMFGIFINPFNDGTTGYGFYVNAAGAWREEQISQGTVEDATWDTKWKGETKRTPEFWYAEFEIPFKYFRNKGGANWSFNFVRNDDGANERSSWVKVPINFQLNNLAFSGKVNFAQPILEQKKTVQIIPSVTTIYNSLESENAKMKSQVSLDAKIALSSSINLDLTINPDFSQTNADVLQLNLTRFELVYPENRLFFIENSDLFAAFGDEGWGNPVNRPFYSRRIGLRYDDRLGSFLPTRILGGARVSGKLNNDLRFGAMTILTDEVNIEEGVYKSYEPAQNYSVAAIQQKVFSRSNISAVFVNKQAVSSDGESGFSWQNNEYNRVLGLEYNFANSDDKISGKLYHHFEFNNLEGKPEFSRGILLNHNTQYWRNWIHLTQISDDYRPETGLISRNGLYDVNVHLARSVYPRKGKINQIEFLTNSHIYLDSRGDLNDYFIISGIHIVSKTTYDFWFVNIREQITLREAFDPSFNDLKGFDPGYVSQFNYWRVAYGSDMRKPLRGSVVLDYGGYYTGTQFNFETNINYRVQHYVNLGLSFRSITYRLPEPLANNNITYLGPRIDVTFNRNLYWTSLIQYNSLFGNMNVYSRLQWRFRPLSDIFLIYSGNQNQLSPNVNDLIFKVVYWL